MFYGRGAGSLPTGSAVVSDIVAILRSNVDVANYSHIAQNDLWHREVQNISESQSKFYIRITVTDQPGVLGEITTTLGKYNVSLRSVIQKGEENSKGEVTIVLFTHKSSEADVNNAKKELMSLKSVITIDNVIRIEDFKN